MTNPAELLLNLFHSWNGTTSDSPQTVRKDENLINHFLAVKYLNEIDAALTRCENLGKQTRIARKYFPEWKRIVFNYPRDWQNVHHSSINEMHLEHLETTIMLIDDVCPPIPEDALAQLTNFLDTVDNLLREDETLPEKIKLSVRVVLDELKTCTDNLAVSSSFEIQEAVYRLLGALVFVLANSGKNKEWGDIIKNFATNFATGWITNQVPALPVQELSQLMGS